ncbi:MAG: hypothetical protein IPL46_25955 [Saprospiraceae bacterium]|nr:hypothetical protein [Saprospiraceae bacterium]
MKFEEGGRLSHFMVSGNFGVALFPAPMQDLEIPHPRPIKIDHFAFRVSRIAFQTAREFFKKKHLHYRYQDHHYFQSIYLHDPDGHEVELTCTTEFSSSKVT